MDQESGNNQVVATVDAQTENPTQTPPNPNPEENGAHPPDSAEDTAQQPDKAEDVEEYKSRLRKAWEGLKRTDKKILDAATSLLSPNARNESIAKFVMEATDQHKKAQAEQFDEIGEKADVKRDGAIADFGDGAKRLADTARTRASDADPKWEGSSADYFKNKRAKIADRIKARAAEMTAVHFAKKVDKYNAKLEPKLAKKTHIESQLAQEKSRPEGKQNFARMMKLENKQRRLESKTQPLQGKVEENKARSLALRENAINARTRVAARR